VSRRILQHWSIVLLLIARLVLGEFAHAMPHQNESDVSAAAQVQAVPCPDHGAKPGEGHRSMDSGEATAKAHDAGSHDTNCCKTACNCPCLHLSTMAMPSAIVNVAAADQRGFPTDALGHTPDRITLLFRPPA